MNESLYIKHLPYFQNKYNICICPSSRINDLTEFIDTYWKKNHIFVRSIEFFKWQHYNQKTDCYNFIIAVHKYTNEIHAIFGYTLTSHFDREIKEPVVWGSIWKVRPDINEPGLGMMLTWKSLDMFYNYGHVGLGLSNEACRITKKGCTVGTAIQYYILHPSKTKFKIAIISSIDKRNSNSLVNKKKRFIKLKLNDYDNYCNELLCYIPLHKSKYYYINRFFKHPIYEYQSYAIIDGDNNINGIFFCRLCYYMSAICIRIVDYFGQNNTLNGCLDCFNDLLSINDAEYIDFICVNMPAEEMDASGFLDRVTQKDIIIPNYFEPFVQSNINVMYNIVNTQKPRDCRIFKGDSDQDRPS